MTLTTHALAGAAAATIFPMHPLAGFAAGFVSHFILDAIPHWDYKVPSVHEDRGRDKMYVLPGPEFWKDVAKVVLDCALGFGLAVFFFGDGAAVNAATVAAFSGAFGGMFPDGLSFVYYSVFKKEPLISLEIFHKSIQKDERFQERPFAGITLQILIIAAVAGLSLIARGI